MKCKVGNLETLLRQILGYPACVLRFELRHNDNLIAELAKYGRRLVLNSMMQGALDVGWHVVLVPDFIKLS